MNIKEQLKGELRKYSWSSDFVVKCLSESICYVNFPLCNIIFYYNKMYTSIECNIYNPVNPEEKYGLKQVLEYNDVDLPNNFLTKENAASIDEYFVQYVYLINTYLSKVTEGDFSWAEKILILRRNTGEIQKKLGKTLIFHTSIYKKMKAGEKI